MRPFLMLVADLVLVGLATLLAMLLRHDFAVPVDRLIAVLPYAGFSMLSALVAIVALGQHRMIWRMSGFGDYWRHMFVALLSVFGAMAIGFLVDRLEGVPRSLPMLQGTLIVTLMVGGRVLSRASQEMRRGLALHEDQQSPRRPRATVLVVGLNATTELYLRAMAEIGRERCEIAGILSRNKRQVGRRARSHRVLGTPEDVGRVLRDLEVEGIVVTTVMIMLSPAKLSAEARQALDEVARQSSIAVQYIAEALDLTGSGATSEAAAVAGLATPMTFSPAELQLVEDRRYFAWKRALDVVAALLLILVTAPLAVLVTLLVAIDVGVPVTFCQQRPGRWGIPFKVYKFRTMSGAYDQDDRRIPEHDRVSWIGRFLRRSRLDELPQLYNVLMGDMSFVGPRPLLPVDQAPEYKARLLVRPGITGFAQVEGGRIVDPVDKAALDLYYVRHASLMLDLCVLLRTIPMMLCGDRVNRAAVERAWQDLTPTGLCSTWTRAQPQEQAEDFAGFDILLPCTKGM